MSRALVPVVGASLPAANAGELVVPVEKIGI